MSDWVSWLFWQSVALISENLMLAEKHEIEMKYKFYAFLFILVREDPQNCDEHIAFIDGEKVLCWGMWAAIDFSLCIWKENLFSQMQVSLLH